LDTAAVVLVGLGHTVVDGTNPQPWDEPLLEAMLAAFGAGLAASARAAVPPGRWPLMRPYTRWSVERGESIDAADYLAATGLLARAASAHLTAAADFDAVLTPTTTEPAVPVGWFSRDGVENEGRHMLGWSAFTPWANMTGQPSMSLPLHTTPTGLPVGVMLTAARRGDDGLLISLAGQVERAAPFSHRHPPQW
jgi:amidase